MIWAVFIYFNVIGLIIGGLIWGPICLYRLYKLFTKTDDEKDKRIQKELGILAFNHRSIATTSKPIPGQNNSAASPQPIVEKLKYFRKWGVVKEGKVLSHIKVKYFHGHPAIDSKKDKDEFYLWVDNESLHLLDSKIYSNVGKYTIYLEDIETFRQPDNTCTWIYCRDMAMKLDGSVYAYLCKNIPKKQYGFIDRSDLIPDNINTIEG
jgi:hypothetical protein